MSNSYCNPFNRNGRRAIAEATKIAMKEGGYDNSLGERVDLTELMHRSQVNSRVFSHSVDMTGEPTTERFEALGCAGHEVAFKFDVVNEDSGAPNGDDTEAEATESAATNEELPAEHAESSNRHRRQDDVHLPDISVAVSIDTTLGAGYRLRPSFTKVGLMNFASAKNPGGGWDSGAQAQEESLGRSSALVPCLLRFGGSYYSVNRRCGNTLYTSTAIVSPDVPFFKDDNGEHLDEPALFTVVTIPAPNCGAYMRNKLSNRDAVTEALRDRIARALWLFAASGCDCLVLGAYGCGVFRNDPQEVAAIFAESLKAPFCRRFRHVEFAITAPEMANTFGRCFGLEVTVRREQTQGERMHSKQNRIRHSKNDESSSSAPNNDEAGNSRKGRKNKHTRVQ
jgi:uncharacterized protein (TIGR02452 family)